MLPRKIDKMCSHNFIEARYFTTLSSRTDTTDCDRVLYISSVREALNATASTINHVIWRGSGISGTSYYPISSYWIAR